MKKLLLCVVLAACCSVVMAGPTSNVFDSPKTEIEYLTSLIIGAKEAGLAPNPAWYDRLAELMPAAPARSLDQGNDACPATVITACPFTDTGTTTGYTNDYQGSCIYDAGAPDVIYQYTAAATGVHVISLCGSSFDTGLYVKTGGTCPGTTEIACNDDFCGVQSQVSVGLTAGTTYWIIVDGYYTNSGAYTLSMTCPAGCTPDFNVTAPGVWTGTTCGAVDNCALRAGEDHIYRVTIPVSGDWTFKLCETAYYFDTYMFLGTACCLGDIASSDDGCSPNGLQSIILCRTLAAGTYYVDIEPYGSTSCGNYTLTVERCQPCIIECQPGDIAECYENAADTSFYRTDCNGGCNSEPDIFQTLGCGETVCGDVFTYVGPGGASYRDTDWYLFTMTNTSNVSWTVVAEVAVNMFILDVTNCLSVVVLASGSAPTPCTPSTITAVALGPGTYAAWVGPTVFSGVPPSDYRGTLTWECPPPECPTDSVVVRISDYNPAGSDPVWDVDFWWCLHLNSGLVPSWICIEAYNPSNLPVWGFVAPGCYDPMHCWEPNCEPVAGFRIDPVIWVPDPTPTNPSHGWYCTAFWKVPEQEYGCCLCVNLDRILPVGLSSFTATAGDNSVTLDWATASESNADHFEVFRDENLAGNVRATNNANGSHYSWVDDNAVNGTTYTYRLVGVDVNGSRQDLGTVSATPVMSAATVTEYALHQNYPNPFNPSTTIAFDMIEAGHVSLKIYNLMGQEVASVVNGAMGTGRHLVTFNADNLTSGVYLYRLTVNGFAAEKKMLLMK